MYDDRDHAVLCPGAVCAVGFGPTTIEADHRILHADPLGVDADGHWVRVLTSEFRIGEEGLGYGLSAVLLPQWVALFGVVAHGERGAVLQRDGHGIPNELSARSKGEVPHILGLVAPCLEALFLGLLVFSCLVLRDNQNRTV